MGIIIFGVVILAVCMVLAVATAWTKDGISILFLVLGFFLVLILVFGVVPAEFSNRGVSETYLRGSAYPGVKYQVVKVVGQFDGQVEMVLFNDKSGKREYYTISREVILNDEIPLDAEELRALRTVKGIRIIMGPFETFDLDEVESEK